MDRLHLWLDRRSIAELQNIRSGRDLILYSDNKHSREKTDPEK
jgi:hypothetical protein